MTVSFDMAKNYFKESGLELREFQYQQLSVYLHELIKANTHINLTAITEPVEIWKKHFLDSAVLLQKVKLPLGESCLDVGTGAGFPGMVLAILRPDLKITLLDSLQKRIGFLTHLIETLGIDHIQCVHGRAEDAGKNVEYREQFDFVTARAVAPLPILMEYCLPFVKIGGSFAAMKGPSESVADGKQAAAVLGGEMISEEYYDLFDVGKRQIILIHKTEHTPEKYPRRSDKVKKNPL